MRCIALLAALGLGLQGCITYGAATKKPSKEGYLLAGSIELGLVAMFASTASDDALRIESDAWKGAALGVLVMDAIIGANLHLFRGALGLDEPVED